VPARPPLATLRRVSWAQLGDHDYISVGRTSGNRVLLDQALAGVAGRPQAIYEAQHVTTTLGLVEAGLGVGRGAVDGDARPRSIRCW
jgi:DNA-binding transcriptional LysR family regulator